MCSNHSIPLTDPSTGIIGDAFLQAASRNIQNLEQAKAKIQELEQQKRNLLEINGHLGRDLENAQQTAKVIADEACRTTKIHQEQINAINKDVQKWATLFKQADKETEKLAEEVESIKKDAWKDAWIAGGIGTLVGAAVAVGVCYGIYKYYIAE